eukprot:gene19375-biopygen33845
MNVAPHVRYPQPRRLHLLLQQGLKLQQQISFITRPKVVNKMKVRDRGSIIDHVWTKMTCRCSVLHALGSLSDHEAIRVNHGRSTPPVKSKRKVEFRRAWRKVDKAAVVKVLDREMPSSSWSALQKDAQQAMEKWDSAWTAVKKELAPRRRFPVKPKAELIKVSGELRAARKERNRLLRIARKGDATSEDKARYWQSRDAAIKLYRSNVERHVQKHWEEAGEKPMDPAHWRLVNGLTGRKARDRVEPDCSPDKVNDTFLAKPAKIREPLLRKPPPRIRKRSGPTLQRLAAVNDEDVLTALRQARSTHSVGIDEVPMSVLKRLGDGIAPYITVLANAIIAAHWWPPAWKQAEVHPLWKKKGSKNDPATYRPISLLPAVARIVERLIAKQLKAHVQRMLPAFQHGFRPKHSCLTALAQLIDHVGRARDAGEVVAVASADLAGAFDTVDHDILLEKVEKICGLRGSVLTFMRHYLQGREQRTVLSEERKSVWRQVPCGVPQGSVLGPLLFALYTLDVGDHVKGTHIIQYADDLNFVVSAKCPREAVAHMDRVLAQLLEYATTNRLAPEPTAAESVLQRAYNRTARMAVRCKRSAPARARLGWPRWERRQEAARAAFVAKVWEEGEPTVLKELFPPLKADIQNGMLTRSAVRGELTEPAARRAIGEKAFTVWAPRVLNRVINDTVFEDCSSEEEQEQPPPATQDPSTQQTRGKAPADEYAVQRRTHYAELVIKFAGQ